MAQLQDTALSMDAQFHSLSLDIQAAGRALNHSRAALHSDLGQLKATLRKTQHRSRQVDGQLQALGAALSRSQREQAREREAWGKALSGLVRDARAQQDALAHLLRLVQSQGAMLAALERPLQGAGPDMTTLPRPPPPCTPEPVRGRQILSVPPEPGLPPRGFTDRLGDTREPRGPGSPGTWPPRSSEESK